MCGISFSVFLYTRVRYLCFNKERNFVLGFCPNWNLANVLCSIGKTTEFKCYFDGDNNVHHLLKTGIGEVNYLKSINPVFPILVFLVVEVTCFSYVIIFHCIFTQACWNFNINRIRVMLWGILDVNWTSKDLFLTNFSCVCLSFLEVQFSNCGCDFFVQVGCDVHNFLEKFKLDFHNKLAYELRFKYFY